MVPTKISETREVAEYLVKRGIFDTYLKCKAYVLAGRAQKLDFKLRQPKNAGIYQFRINQKYRAF